MKVLLLFIGIFPLMTAIPVDKNEETERLLRHTARAVLSECKNLRNEIDTLLEQKKDVEASIPDYVKKIPEAISANALVVASKKAIVNAKRKGKDVEECSKMFIEHENSIVSDLKKEFIELVKGTLQVVEVTFGVMKKQLVSVEYELEYNLDKQLENCTKKETCKITGEYIDLIEGQWKYIGIAKDRLQDVAEEAFVQFEKVDIPEISKLKIQKPVNSCLKQL